MISFNIELPQFPDINYSIEKFGAIGDGIFSNTLAINTTIQKLSEIGGGTVTIPRGIWLTGPVELKSNINLHLESGAVLLFSKSKEEYPLIITDYEGQPCIRTVSPLSAKNASNIAITGSGVIDGNGQLWRPIKQFKMTERQWKEQLNKSEFVVDTKEGGIWMPTESIYEGYLKGAVNFEESDALEKAAPYYDYYRPVLLSLQYCNKVLIDGVTIQNSPAWNVHPYYCENLTIRNTTIFNPYHAQNGDGLDMESCKNVHVHDCTFQTGDDAICLKSGKNAIARQKDGPTENVYIHDCYVGWGHGGFVVGSEMSRGIKNVTVENCTFFGTDVGIRFKSALGRGGVVENIIMKDINMVDIKEEAVLFTMGYVLNSLGKDEKIEETANPEDIPRFANIEVDGIVCHGANIAVKVLGLDMKHPTIENIAIKNSIFQCENKYDIKFAENVTLENVLFQDNIK